MLQSLLGILVFPALAWVLGSRSRQVSWRLATGALGLQIGLAVVFVFTPGLRDLLAALNSVVLTLDQSTTKAAGFMFGYLAGAALPFEETSPGGSFIVAFRVLPLIMVVSAISAVLFHWGVLQRVVAGFAWLLKRVMGISGPLGFSASSTLFLGIIEAPLIVKPYLQKMSSSELLALMTCAMATVAGTVMVLYASVLEPVLPNAMGHILVASAVSIPAALLMAHLHLPGEIGAESEEKMEIKVESQSTMDALMRGTREGLEMCLQIAATIIVLFALVHFFNAGLGLLPGELTLERMVAWVFAPIVWLMGIPAEEVMVAAELMGTKTVLNEFVAYLNFASTSGAGLSETSRVIMVYAMCGFANLGSLGILVGGLDAIIPERRKEVAALSFRAILTGTLATCSTGALIGVLAHAGLVSL